MNKTQKSPFFSNRAGCSRHSLSTFPEFWAASVRFEKQPGFKAVYLHIICLDGKRTGLTRRALIHNFSVELRGRAVAEGSRGKKKKFEEEHTTRTTFFSTFAMLTHDLLSRENFVPPPNTVAPDEQSIPATRQLPPSSSSLGNHKGA